MTFTLQYLAKIRTDEIDRLRKLIPAGCSILEIGGGTGYQAKMLADAGYAVSSIDLSSSNYAQDRIYSVTDYDGYNIPFPDHSFDVIYSSNVMEHIADHTLLYHDMKRVLKPGGRIIHIVPTPVWRLGTLMTDIVIGPCVVAKKILRHDWMGLKQYLKCALHLKPHGERGNAITEIYYFSDSWWKNNFSRNGFKIISTTPGGLFYTGNGLVGAYMPVSLRAGLAQFLGSSTRIYSLAVV